MGEIDYIKISGKGYIFFINIDGYRYTCTTSKVGPDEYVGHMEKIPTSITFDEYTAKILKELHNSK